MRLSPTTPARMEKIEAWLVWVDERYQDLLSRAAETASLSGWHVPDQKGKHGPRLRPCECRPEWRRGGLCLLCDNNRWRKCWPWEEGIDPYAADVPQVKGGFYAQSAGDESPAQRRSASDARLTREIQKLETNERIRQGIEAVEDEMLGKLRRISRKPRALRKIERAVVDLADKRPDLYRTLPHGKFALLHLALLVPGRIDPPRHS